MLTAARALQAFWLLPSVAAALRIAQSGIEDVSDLHQHSLRKAGPLAVLLISGQIRTEKKVCKQQLDMIVKANPHFLFDVWLVSDTSPNENCVAAARAEPNVRNTTVLDSTQMSPDILRPSMRSAKERCIDSAPSHEGDGPASPKERKQKHCEQLFKQYLLHQTIVNNAYSPDDLFIHTRFDVWFDGPLHLDNLAVNSTLYVLRSTWFKTHASGNVYDQKNDPIVWKGKFGLNNSVPDYAFIGSWKHVSVALRRFEFLMQVIDGTARASCESGHCQESPEELLHAALAQEGIYFDGSPPVQLLFASPCVEILRRMWDPVR